MTKREVLERLSEMASLADELGVASVSIEIGEMMSRLAASTEADVAEIEVPVSKLRAEAVSRGDARVVTAADGFLGNLNDWFEKRLYGGQAGQLVSQINQSGYLNQLSKYLNSFSPFWYKRVDRKQMRPISEPLYKMLSEFWALAKKAGQKLPELPNIKSLLNQRGMTARVAKEYVDQVRSLMRQYVTNDVAKEIDQMAGRRPAPATPRPPMPRPEAAPAATTTPSAPTAATPTPPAAPAPTGNKAQELLKDYKKNFTSHYFNGKPQLTEQVVDAIINNWKSLPTTKMRDRAQELVEYVRKLGGAAKTALAVEKVYQTRLQDVRRLFEDFFGSAEMGSAQAFVDGVYADLKTSWDKEFEEVAPPASPAPAGAPASAPTPTAAPSTTPAPVPPATAPVPTPAPAPSPAAPATPAITKAEGPVEYVDDPFSKRPVRKRLGTLAPPAEKQIPTVNKGKGTIAL